MPVSKLYYHLKPYLPWGLRMAVRRTLARRKRLKSLDVWPINPAAGQPPSGWPGWPARTPWRSAAGPALHGSEASRAFCGGIGKTSVHTAASQRLEQPFYEATTPHIASPDVHVDEGNRRIIMYYHELEEHQEGPGLGAALHTQRALFLKREV
jgi:hypothetical protein